jgi:hypothetical protein
MKTRDCSETPLTLAFRFAETAENGWQRGTAAPAAQFD